MKLTEWHKNIRGHEALSEFQRLAIDILCAAMRTGPHNIGCLSRFDPSKRQGIRLKWSNQISFPIRYGCLATADGNCLTRLVILAHEFCVRVEINPCNAQHLRVYMGKRDENARDSWTEGHPTIEKAIESLRNQYKETKE